MVKKHIIDEKLVERLAELARIDLGRDKKKLVKDLEKIVEYFDNLNEVNTESVQPVSGGGDLENIFREDKYDEKERLPKKKAVEDFPEEKNGFLKVPPVFE